MARRSKDISQLLQVQELGKRLTLLAVASATVWFLHSEALRGLLRGMGRILAKIR